jgi:dipeptidyl aminopeptidase/acylaminoacyl peptidase
MSYCTALLLACLPQTAPESGYMLPPPEMVALLDAAPTPSVRPSPNARWLLLVERPSMPPLADVLRPWIGLAGSRIDPVTRAPKRELFETGLILRALEGGEERRVALPSGARIDGVSWSHTSQHFAFALRTHSGVELYAVDVETLAPKQVAVRLNTMLAGWSWDADGRHLLCALVPDDLGAAPAPPVVPSGPAIQETQGEVSPTRTFQDLLQDEHDCQLFEHYGRSQLVRVSVDGGQVERLGAAGLIDSFDPSPSGEYLLVARIERPFSYLLTSGSFPRRYEIWNRTGALVHTAAVQPLGENIPIEGVRTGPRQLAWKASAPASLTWFEALDGGDPRRAAEHRDRALALDAPFTGEPRELLQLQHRARGLTWFADPNLVAASEFDRDKRWTRTRLIALDGSAEPRVLDDRSVNERYKDPGSIVQVAQPDGTRLPLQDGEWIYRAGMGATPQGSRPFLDRQNLSTLASERLWQCAEGRFETFSAVVAHSSGAKPSVLITSESPDQPPSWKRLDLEAGSSRDVLAMPDPQPALRGITKRLIRYKREDGVDLSATLYLPKDHVEGTRLPLVVWAYPTEYNDPQTAGQVSGSPYRFTRISGPSHLFFLLAGYAVLDDAAMPVVGDPLTMNDSFLDQIVASAKAAVAEADRLGVGDPSRAGVGGHSYGAFMTANLLAHCDVFKAGIARSGAYNRTLTPFGFQSERRTLWEAPEVYGRLSPFFSAHRINEPLLMIHGERDSNSGTFPMQSERLFQAIKGHGGWARLVVLPGEDHGYQGRESVLHCLAEMLEWFDEHVKNVPGAGAQAPGPAMPVEAGASQR